MTGISHWNPDSFPSLPKAFLLAYISYAGGIRGDISEYA
jgi:hypothetical protein